MFGAAFPIIPTLGDTVGGPIGPRVAWPNGYRYRIRYVITREIHQQPNGAQGWVKLRITNGALRSTANGGHVVNDAIWPDISFEMGAGLPLKFEIESWSATTGALVVYLLLSNFTASGDYTVLLYSGKAGITENPSDTIACWDKYVQSVKMSTGADMSGNGRHLTLTGVTTATLFGSGAGDFAGGDAPPPPPPPPPAWWNLSIRSGRAWASGTSFWFDRIVSAAPAAFAAEEEDVALIDAIAGSSTGDNPDRLNVATWDNLIGGPIGGPLVSLDTHFDWREDVRFGFGDGVVQMAGKDGWLVWVGPSIPKSEAVGGPTDTAIWDAIIAGTHDAKYVKWGERIVTKMAEIGKPLTRLLLDFNHEMNQSNIYQVFPGTRTKYKAAMERTIDKLRQGATNAGATTPLRFIHRPAYRNEPALVGPYVSYVPSNIDVLSLSIHPGAAVNSDANVTKLFNGTLNPDWYGVTELLNASVSLDKPIAFTEWSPKNEADDPCPIANTFITRFYNEVLAPNASKLVCDCIFSQEMRYASTYEGTTSAGQTQFTDMVSNRKSLWSGTKFTSPTAAAAWGGDFAGPVIMLDKHGGGGTTRLDTGEEFAWSFISPFTGAVSEFHFSMRTADGYSTGNGGTFIFRVYADTADKPGAQIGGDSATNGGRAGLWRNASSPAPSVRTWVSLSTASPPALVKGTKYWLAFNNIGTGTNGGNVNSLYIVPSGTASGYQPTAALFGGPFQLSAGGRRSRPTAGTWGGYDTDSHTNGNDAPIRGMEDLYLKRASDGTVWAIWPGIAPVVNFENLGGARWLRWRFTAPTAFTMDGMWTKLYAPAAGTNPVTITLGAKTITIPSASVVVNANGSDYNTNLGNPIPPQFFLFDGGGTFSLAANTQYSVIWTTTGAINMTCWERLAMEAAALETPWIQNGTLEVSTNSGSTWTKADGSDNDATRNLMPQLAFRKA